MLIDEMKSRFDCYLAKKEIKIVTFEKILLILKILKCPPNL